MAIVCDICKLPLLEEATSVQILPGRINHTTGGVNMRSVRGAKAFNLCTTCAAVVHDYMGHLVRGDSIAEAHPDGGACPVGDPAAHLAAQ